MANQVEVSQAKENHQDYALQLTEQTEESAPKIYESKVLIFDNVFPNNQEQDFLHLIEKWQDRFQDTQVGDDKTATKDKKYRNSLVLFEFEPIRTYFKSQIFRFTQPVKEAFGYEMTPEMGGEFQLTAHNDQNFYSAHTDFLPNTGTRVSLRKITFVYYFHRQPKAFEGGELYVWDHLDCEGDRFRPTKSGKYIEPLNNRIVFFDSRYYHEVRKVTCASKDFMDSRFTINGWFYSLREEEVFSKNIIGIPVKPHKS
jgi:Rps23 Pro-64 3,4-dihydroxylase Tpa1-like proline 4-hydroxylase